ncbi:hypothetical protein BACCAP_01482 [Pseudoflavonifractor capillosus ATCC 29799]|uniref:Uncharacterized protein n=1 Tax=Pseudoflavonifractor capillosus ATCC 29799 TaxID=411467 RepID=A6NTF3_9FIRM|nr:hypothetical protein BACCAP_01482 [Pseudoflavonifractor capillosus ATCC 29799]
MLWTATTSCCFTVSEAADTIYVDNFTISAGMEEALPQWPLR